MKKIGFNDFKKLALNSKLSKYQKIGFPDAYRENTEDLILLDIFEKCPSFQQESKIILDIGPGCSDLATKIISNSQRLNQKLFLIDSSEMLDQLDDAKCITKLPARFPKCQDFLNNFQNKVDVILCYSVFHYIFSEGNIFNFLDSALSLLSPGGQMLIGDIPNISKRKRFFSSKKGIEFHKEFTKTDSDPEVNHFKVEHDEIDDSVIFSILQRARNQGFDSYLLPQNSNLYMANRREDILILKKLKVTYLFLPKVKDIYKKKGKSIN